MRRIPIEDLEVPQDWIDKAKVATDELEAAADRDERNAIIDKYNGLWGELKDPLLALSHNKCWFSETKDVYSYRHVDHFRPKKKARDVDGKVRDRNGYWWLAFVAENYRFCGSVGNQGKGDHFPLRPGSFVATATARRIADEEPYLLDPTDEADYLLLTFNEDGEPKAVESAGEWNRKRVDYTVRRMKLDYEPLVEKRRELWQECRRLINDYKTKLKRWEEEGGATARSEAKSALARLAEMVRPRSELSATAAECFRKDGDPILARLGNRN